MNDYHYYSDAVYLFCVNLFTINCRSTDKSIIIYLAPGVQGEKEEVAPTVVGPTTPGPEPWWKIRLPRDVQPYHYDLILHIDLNKPHFKGAVATGVDVLSPTPYILLHAVDMNITKAEVRKVSGGEWQSHNIDLHSINKSLLERYLRSSVT